VPPDIGSHRRGHSRRACKPADRTGAWRVLEDELVVAGTKKTDPALRLRRVFVHSSVRAAATVTARAEKLDRARDDLERPTAAGSKPCRC
jgi:hypothetical protein